MSFAAAPSSQPTAVNFRLGSPKLRFPRHPEACCEAAPAVRSLCPDRGASRRRRSVDRHVGGRLPPCVVPGLFVSKAERPLSQPHHYTPAIPPHPSVDLHVSVPTFPA